MALALGNMGLDPSLINLLHEVMDLDLIEDTETSSQLQAHQAPSRAFVREARAMAATPADAKELPNAYVYVLDMPGLKKEQIKVAVEDQNTLVVSGERKRERERDQGVRYLKMGRRLGKYLQSFSLPENANKENISAVYQDGVLTVTVEKKAPEEPKKAHIIEVNVV